jgi:hypothetical protein
MTGTPPLDDDALLARTFAVKEPLADSALVLELPPGVTLGSILAAYNHRKFKLPCAKCCAARHYRGFLVELSNGRRTLVGHHCGAKAFGDSWNDHHTAFRGLVDRQAMVRRAAALVAGWSGFSTLLAGRKPCLRASTAAWAAFEDGFPELVLALRVVAEKADGVLELETGRLGTLLGREAFEAGSLSRRLDGLRDELANAIQNLSQKSLPDKTLRQTLRLAADVLTRLHRVGTAHNAVLAFLSPDNVSLITTWAASMPVLADLYLRDGRLTRRFICRQEQVVIEPLMVVRAKRNPGKLAKRLIAKAQAEGWFNELPERHPKWFVQERVSRSRRVINTAIEVVEVPRINDPSPVDVSMIEENQ